MASRPRFRQTLSKPEWLRLQLDWERRDVKPTPGRTDVYIAQLIAIF